MKTKLLLSLSLLINTYGFGQILVNGQIIIDTTSIKLLFRGRPNSISSADSCYLLKITSLRNDSLFKTEENPSTIFIYPNLTDSSILLVEHFYLNGMDTSIYSRDRFVFYIRQMPRREIFIGDARNGQTLDWDNLKIRYGYTSEIANIFKEKIYIAKYSLFIPSIDKTFLGSDDGFTEQIVGLLHFLDSETKIELTILSSGSFCNKTSTAVFYTP